ncbi:hypothetical protein AMTRI_Chr08g163350 [Amborella trichopoda]
MVGDFLNPNLLGRYKLMNGFQGLTKLAHHQFEEMREKASGSRVYWIFIISDYTVYFDQNIFKHGEERKTLWKQRGTGKEGCEGEESGALVGRERREEQRRE